MSSLGADNIINNHELQNYNRLFEKILLADATWLDN